MTTERLTAEEAIRKHCNTEFSKTDGTEQVYSSLDAVIIALTEFAAQEVEAEIKKLMPSNKKINEAARAWAKDHSNAPDKDCPEWILQDYEAGACFVRQCFGCLNKEVEAVEKQRDELLEALKNITDPIGYMRSKLEAGESLNGHYAIQLANDAQYLRGIAEAAIINAQTE